MGSSAPSVFRSSPPGAPFYTRTAKLEVRFIIGEVEVCRLAENGFGPRQIAQGGENMAHPEMGARAAGQAEKQRLEI